MTTLAPVAHAIRRARALCHCACAVSVQDSHQQTPRPLICTLSTLAALLLRPEQALQTGNRPLYALPRPRQAIASEVAVSRQLNSYSLPPPPSPSRPAYRADSSMQQPTASFAPPIMLIPANTMQARRLLSAGPACTLLMPIDKAAVSWSNIVAYTMLAGLIGPTCRSNRHPTQAHDHPSTM